jgi:hypothetical protein
MKKLIAMGAFIVVAAALLAPAAALAAGRQAGETGRQTGVSGVHAGVTCHDPCDDPFQLKAWVRGGHVSGIKVQFDVKGHKFTARTSSSGYAHYHLDMNPAAYPQGEVVKVVASVTHGGVTKTDSTWFKPNYN